VLSILHTMPSDTFCCSQDVGSKRRRSICLIVTQSGCTCSLSTQRARQASATRCTISDATRSRTNSTQHSPKKNTSSRSETRLAPAHAQRNTHHRTQRVQASRRKNSPRCVVAHNPNRSILTHPFRRTMGRGRLLRGQSASRHHRKRPKGR
jgi:hypothetical protein